MPKLIDTSVWVAFTRTRSSKGLKQFIAPFVLHADAHVAEPVLFELLRHATPKETAPLSQLLQTLPTLTTPTDVWTAAARLAQACREKGFTARSLDLLIAGVALHHKAEVITFDEDFRRISAASGLRVNVLSFPPEQTSGLNR